eukprot:5686402-Amphidinium_carterae.1
MLWPSTPEGKFLHEVHLPLAALATSSASTARIAVPNLVAESQAPLQATTAVRNFALRKHSTK